MHKTLKVSGTSAQPTGATDFIITMMWMSTLVTDEEQEISLSR